MIEKCLFGKISLYSEEFVQAGQHKFTKFVEEMMIFLTIYCAWIV